MHAVLWAAHVAPKKHDGDESPKRRSLVFRADQFTENMHACFGSWKTPKRRALNLRTDQFTEKIQAWSGSCSNHPKECHWFWELTNSPKKYMLGLWDVQINQKKVACFESWSILRKNAYMLWELSKSHKRRSLVCGPIHRKNHAFWGVVQIT